MSKQQLIDDLAAMAKVTKAQAGAVLEALGNKVTAVLQDGDEITLPRVGKLSARPRSARTVRNPRTGEKIDKPETRSVKFTVSTVLKAAVR